MKKPARKAPIRRTAAVPAKRIVAPQLDPRVVAAANALDLPVAPPEVFTPTLTLPRLDDTSNFAKFGIEVPRGTKGVPFGTIYVPLHAAARIKRLVVRFEQ